MAPSLGARLYEMNVSPTLSYVEQLCPPPPSIETAEKSAIEKTMHAPHNSFVGSSAFYLEQAGMINRSIHPPHGLKDYPK